MGNRSTFKGTVQTLVQKLVHAALIISFSVTSFSGSHFSFNIQAANAAADGSNGADTKAIKQALTRLANTTIDLTESDIQIIEKLNTAHYFETGLAAIIRLDQLVARMDVDQKKAQKEIDADLITALTRLLAAQASLEHVDYLEELNSRLDQRLNDTDEVIHLRTQRIGELAALASQTQVQEKLSAYRNNMDILSYEIKQYSAEADKFQDLKHFIFALTEDIKETKISNNPKIPGSLSVIDKWVLDRKNTDGNTGLSLLTNGLKTTYLEDVERIEDYMKANVLGQDKAIESFARIEVEKHVKGYVREKPIVRYLMGLPGTGKDTLVENYIDAIFNKKNAWKEHMYRFPTVKGEKDVWSIIGSGKGYVGSNELTDFVKFLANHSGGRYFVRTDDRGQESVRENPKWKGQNLSGYNAPEDAVIFINEGHNWSSQAKDTLLKQAVEKGFYKVNGTNGGVEAIYSAVTIVFATNEGIELLTSRDENGRQTGKNKTDAELQEAYKLYEGDKAALRHALMAKNGQHVGDRETLGMSEEFNNRIKDEEIILLKPLTPDEKKQIVRIKMKEVEDSISKGAGGFGQIKVTATDALVNFTQEYRDNPEAGARPIDGKLEAMMNNVFAAIKERKITGAMASNIVLDIEKNADKTTSLVYKNGADGSVMYKQVLDFTARDRQIEKMSYDEFDRLAQLPETLNKKIYGNKEAMDKIGKAVAISQQAREAYQNNRENHKKASSFGLFGYAGLGKTQTAKELTRELTGKDDYLMIDFTNVKTQHDIEKQLIGIKEGSRVIPSEFMKAYDRKAGSTLVVLIEEIANTSPELLKALYPFFDETEVRNFADGKARPMSNVIFLVTGNAGLEIYNDILKLNLPRDVKMQAMSWVYESFIKDSRAQLAALAKSMPIPLMTRFTDIFHFRPVNYEILRNLSQRGLSQGINDLKAKDGVIGWNIGFKNEADYYKTVEIIEKEGFEFENQGRSVVNYSTRVFNTDLKFLLSKNHVADGAKVTLVPRDGQSDEMVNKQGGVVVDVYADGKAEPMQFVMEGQKREKEPRENVDMQKRTAVHEAGHNIVMRLLLNDKISVEYLSIVPGVTSILNQYVFYLGVAKFSREQDMEMTRQAVVEKIAVNAAGAAAQRYVTKGAVDDAGKSNDMEQSTFLARKAVMEWGLSDRFQQHIKYDDAKDLQLLSEADKTVISEEVSKLIKEGDLLAEKVLKTNSELLMKLSNVLLEKGEMHKADLDKFYEESESLIVNINNPAKEAKVSVWDRMRAKATNLVSGVKNHNPEFNDGVVLTDNIANIEKIVNKEKEELLARIPKPEIPIVVADTAAVKSEAKVEFKLLDTKGTAQVTSCSKLFN